MKLTISHYKKSIHCIVADDPYESNTESIVLNNNTIHIEEFYIKDGGTLFIKKLPKNMIINYTYKNKESIVSDNAFTYVDIGILKLVLVNKSMGQVQLRRQWNNNIHLLGFMEDCGF